MIIFRSELQREQNFLADTEPVAWKQHYHKYLNRLFVFYSDVFTLPPSPTHRIVSLAYAVLYWTAEVRLVNLRAIAAQQYSERVLTAPQDRCQFHIYPKTTNHLSALSLHCLKSSLFFFFYCNRYPLSCKVAHDGHEAR